MGDKDRRISRKQGPVCANHTDRFDTKECDRCHKFFCTDCNVEDWHENFFSQFIGKKRDFIKKIYCHPCQKRVVRIRMAGYIGLLLMFGLPVVLWVLISLS
ncbi:MAG: hypothetical protein ACXABU_08435 [Candidatus Hodarchaeales archaeon]|jgi:hypothetical protein